MNKFTWKYELVVTQDREDFYFNGKSHVEDLGDDFKKLCHKANELNQIDGQWGIHHWVKHNPGPRDKPPSFLKNNLISDISKLSLR